MNASHTPGPWLAGKPSSIVGWPIVAPHAHGRLIANIAFVYETTVWNEGSVSPENTAYRAECDANARLIAAAPDILTALWNLSQRVAQTGDDTAEADRALQKAMGQ